MNKNYSNTSSFWGGMDLVSPPLNKMGEKKRESVQFNTVDSDLPLPFENLNPVPYMHMVMTSKGVKPVQCRLPADNEIAVVDWINFTDLVDTMCTKFNLIDSDEVDLDRNFEIAKEIDNYIYQIFGLQLTFADRGMKNRYQSSFEIGDKCGFVCVGGQRGTYLVMLTGRGCSMSKDGWEKRLYTFLNTVAKRGKITRIDLAHDDFSGEKISVDWGDYQDDLGGFQCGNRAPNIEYKGNWKRPNGKGRTLNIGSRESGKYLRLYEKGRAEGDSNDNWQRAEVEFKAKDRILPFDMLLAPSEYFLASYPCFEFLANDIQPARIKTMVKSAQINAKSALETIKNQYGKYINLFKRVFDADELINLISHSDPLSYPSRLDHVVMTAMRM